MTLVAAAVALVYLSQEPWSYAIAVAVVGTALNYLIGDLAILPAAGNVVASIADGVMGAALAWIMAIIWPGVTVGFTALLIFGLIIAVAELFFHWYLRNSEEVAP